jgi:DNA-binding MarR family transcriptional regulator
MSEQGRQPLFMDVMDATRGRKLTPADKLLMAYLAMKQGRNGKSWPGLDTIIHDLDLAKQTVLDSTARLCNAGLVEKAPGRRGRGHSSRYSVRLDKKSIEQTFTSDVKCPVGRPLGREKRSTPQT